MKDIRINITITQAQLEELDAEDRELVERAIKATDNSYAKYSHFQVGAAIRLENGDIIIGANQENAVFPLGLCAERTAIFAAQAQYPEQPIVALAIAARGENGMARMPVSPCGSCRQVISEVEERYGRPMRILLYGTEGVYVIKSVKDLLPLTFADESMR